MTDSKTPQASDAFAVFTHTGSTPVQFELHDKGIVRQQGDAREFTAFAQILDLCLMGAGPIAAASSLHAFAYRTHEAHDWIIVDGGISGFDQLLDAFRERYVAQRLPVLEDLIEAGGRVAFRYIEAGVFPHLATCEVALSAQGLHKEGMTWSYDALQRIDLDDWSETITLQDDSGQPVFACPAMRILSSDLLVNLVYDRLGQTAETV